jgi:cytochrome c-type biogenesis protein CcmE
MTLLGAPPAAPPRQPPVTRTGARWRLVACILVVVAALGWIAARGLAGSFVYYLSPTEVVNQHHAVPGQRIRLGGYVVPGTVHTGNHGLTFTVSDDHATLQVDSTGDVPELFRAGQGVVLEGALGTDGRFHSDTLLVKHDGTYRPPTGKVLGGTAAGGTTAERAAGTGARP